MNRINPLHISLFFLVVFVVLVFKLNTTKSELIEVKKAYKENINIATKLSGLKNAYTKKFILPPSLNALVDQKQIKNGLTISAKKLDLKSLNLLMQKVLNGAYNITKLKITRLNDVDVSLQMEIKW